MTPSVLTVDGLFHPIDAFPDNFIQEILKDNKESQGSDTVVEKAKAAKLIAEDPASPKGMYVMLPRGAVLASLLEEHTRRFHATEGAFPVRPPVLARYSMDAVRSHAELSGEGVYHCEIGGEDSILRHGTIFTQLALCAGEDLNEENLPLKMYEMSPCFRHEQGARIAPLRRPRSFTMIDMHTICRDLEQAKSEFSRLHQKVHDHGGSFGWTLRSTYTVDDGFWGTDGAWVRSLALQEKGPALLKEADPKKQRPINVEYHVMGPVGPLEIAATQIDCCNPERFGLRTQSGQAPVVLHTSIIGSFERFMYALVLEAQDKPEKGLPVWLAPEQVRVLLAKKASQEKIQSMTEPFVKEGQRITVDDRDLPLDEKKKRARDALVPFVLTDEGSGSDRVLEKLCSETKNKPQHPSSFPARLSRWPKAFCV